MQHDIGAGQAGEKHEDCGQQNPKPNLFFRNRKPRAGITKISIAAVTRGLDRWWWADSPPFFDYYRHKNRLLRNDSCWNRLWDEILLLAPDTVVKRPAAHRWQLFSKATMPPRGAGTPPGSSGAPTAGGRPRATRGGAPPKNTPLEGEAAPQTSQAKFP